MTTGEMPSEERAGRREPGALQEPLDVPVTQGIKLARGLRHRSLECLAPITAILHIFATFFFQMAMALSACMVLALLSRPGRITTEHLVYTLAAGATVGLAAWKLDRKCDEIIDRFTPRLSLLAGADGLLLREVMNRKSVQMFIPYSSIVSADTFHEETKDYEGGLVKHDGVVLKLRAGESVKLELGERTPEVLRRICDERATFALTACDAPPPFYRRDRAVGDWLAALRELGSTSHDPYRGSQVTVEQMWRIVETPSAAPTARCGAAVALRATSTRRAGSACAWSPRALSRRGFEKPWRPLRPRARRSSPTRSPRSTIAP